MLYVPFRLADAGWIRTVVLLLRSVGIPPAPMALLEQFDPCGYPPDAV